MSVDGWIRGAALLAIPVIAGVLFLSRTKRPAAPEAAARSPSATTRVSLPDPPEVPAESLAERGEAALAPAPKRLPSVSTPAVDLPPARAAATTPRPAPERPRPPGTGSCGGVEVKLITASEDPAWAFASLSPALGEPAVLRRIGERIGGWQVDRIEWDRVWLRGGGGRCAVGMHFGAAEARASRGKGDEPWRLPAEIIDGIDKRGATERSIEKSVVPALFERAGALLAGLHIEPVKQGDAVVGLELGEIRVDSLLEQLGVESGDVVLALDGEDVTTLEALVKALADARENERIVAKLQRKGEAFELRVGTHQRKIE